MPRTQTKAVIQYEVQSASSSVDVEGAVADITEILVHILEEESDGKSMPGEKTKGDRGSLSSGLIEEEVPSFGTNNQTP